MLYEGVLLILCMSIVGKKAIYQVNVKRLQSKRCAVEKDAFWGVEKNTVSELRNYSTKT